MQPGTGSLQWWLWGEAGTRGGILSRFSRRISFGRVPALGIARIDWCDAIHAGVLSDTIFLVVALGALKPNVRDKRLPYPIPYTSSIILSEKAGGSAAKPTDLEHDLESRDRH